MKGWVIKVAINDTISAPEEVTAVPKLKDMQDTVGGPIEVVPYWDQIAIPGHGYQRCVVLCNENGKLDGLPMNVTATLMWRAYCDDGFVPQDFLAGNIFILAGDDELIDNF